MELYKPYKYYYNNFFYCISDNGNIKIFPIHNCKILINNRMKRNLGELKK